MTSTENTVYDFLISYSGNDKFLSSLAEQLRQTEHLSDKQIAAALRSIGSITRREQENATSSPVIEGRIVIRGEVLSVKTKIYGPNARNVMTVRDERGFKVWGTVPAIIAGGVSRGDLVTFTAQVEKSDRDESFGFFKRPTDTTLVKNA